LSRNINLFLDSQRKIIEAELQKYLAGSTAAPRLSEAMLYSVIHTYSLIHDDLPAMDNDDLRRGKPTCHKKYDEATAILAGDTLQAYAYEILVSGSQKAKVDPVKIIELVKFLGECSGVNGMAGGQMLDLQGERTKLSLKELIKLHQLKTGALLNFAVMAPGMVFDVDQKTKKVLAQYAAAVGLAFQIKDDILDVEGSAQELGKTPGKDHLSEKSTFVKLLGLDNTKKYLIEETNQALDAAMYFGDKNVLMDIAEYLLERKK